MDDEKNNISFENENNKSFMTDPITSSRKDYKYRKYDSLDSIILNQILKNDREKEKEFPMILNSDSDINDFFQKGNKEKQFFKNPEINFNKLDNNQKVKKLNPDILQLFDISNNNNSKIKYKKSNIHNKINNQNNFSNSQIINEINNLNDIFKNGNRDLNNSINIKWKQLNIFNIILNKKLNSKNKNDMIYKGNLNKLILSNIFLPLSYQIYNPGSKKWDTHPTNEEDGFGSGLIPGKYEEEKDNGDIEIKYNDSIQWYCTSVRNDDYGDAFDQ